MNKTIIISIAIAAVVIVGGLLWRNMNQIETTRMIEQKEVMDKPAETNMMNQNGSYIDYSEAALTQATANGKAVLFFHATWCPTCKAANEAFTTKADQIPAGVTILKTDYDTYTDLKKKYNITYQHTFVQVDADGNELAKWNGGDIAELERNIK